jgi:hypothetical protein
MNIVICFAILDVHNIFHKIQKVLRDDGGFIANNIIQKIFNYILFINIVFNADII